MVAPELPEPALAALGERGAELQPRRSEPRRQRPGLAGAQRRDLVVGKTEILRPRELALGHRDPAGELGEVFTIANLEDQRLDFAEHAALVEPHRPIPDLPQRLDIARHPGARMAGAL